MTTLEKIGLILLMLFLTFLGAGIASDYGQETVMKVTGTFVAVAPWLILLNKKL